MWKKTSLTVLLCAGFCVAQDAALTHPERTSSLAEMEGTVVSVDRAHSQLKVKDVKDHVSSIKIVRATTISGTNNKTLTIKDIKEKDTVHIYYTTFDMTARQIDLRTAFPIMREMAPPSP